MEAILPILPPFITRIRNRMIYATYQFFTSVINGKNLSKRGFDKVLLMK
jgi:hypothetical protein